MPYKIEIEDITCQRGDDIIYITSQKLDINFSSLISICNMCSETWCKNLFFSAIIFKKPILVAPGQSLVLYDREIVLGGGVDGLLHVSKLGGGKRIRSAGEVLRTGQEIEGKVEK